MESTKIKTSLPRKGKAIAGAVATLATVTALTMMPTSQAFALIADGGGRSRDSAMQDAMNKASSQCSGVRGSWTLNQEWYNRTWFSAVLQYKCGPDRGVIISGGEPRWKTRKDAYTPSK